MINNNKSIIAFDIGATKIAYGKVQFKTQRSKLKTKTKKSKVCLREPSGVKNLDFKIEHFNKIKTSKKKNEVIKKIIEIVQPFLNPSLVNNGRKNTYGKIYAVGIGMAGQMDFEKGKVLSSPNMPDWKNVSLKKILEKELNLPVSINNDAHSFVMAEARFGAAKNYKHIVGITLGTGIGGGIIINNKLFRGANNTAGELGHTIVTIIKLNANSNVFSNKINYLEAWAGGRGMENLYKKTTGKKLTAVEIEKRAIKGDKNSLKIIKIIAESLGQGLSDIINFFNPEIIVIGGGLSRMNILWKPMVQEAKKRVFFSPLAKTKIVKSKLGDEAGVLGAAILAIE